jgi:hypothetical protein
VILYLTCALVSGAGFAILGWWARGWHCKQANTACPVWQQERKLIWKAKLRKQYPEKPERHHLQRITTQIATPKDLLDSVPEAGAPLPIEPTPTTGVANPRRKVP